MQEMQAILCGEKRPYVSDGSSADREFDEFRIRQAVCQ